MFIPIKSLSSGLLSCSLGTSLKFRLLSFHYNLFKCCGWEKGPGCFCFLSASAVFSPRPHTHLFPHSRTRLLLSPAELKLVWEELMRPEMSSLPPFGQDGYLKLTLSDTIAGLGGFHPPFTISHLQCSWQGKCMSPD